MIRKKAERQAYMNSFLSGVFANSCPKTTDDTVQAISHAIHAITNNPYGVEAAKMDWYEDLESRYFFNMTATVALKYGTYGVRGHYVFGPCGTMSRLLLNSLWELNIPARKLQLLNNEQGKGGGHTLVEYLDGDKWKVIAVSDSSFVWRNKAGEIASVKEIQHEAGVFEQIYATHPDYPYLFDNAQHLNWAKVPSWITSILRSTIGESAMQQIETPRIYEHPRHLLLLCFVGLFIVSSIISLQLSANLKEQDKRDALKASVRALHRSVSCQPVQLISGNRRRANLQRSVKHSV